MIVDASAILVVLFEEPEAARFLRHLRAAVRPLLSAANWLELAIVVDGRRGRSGCPHWTPFSRAST